MVKIGNRWWFRRIWKWNIYLNKLCFTWLALENKILTGDNFIKRGGYSPNVCWFCLSDEESVNHMLVCHVPMNSHPLETQLNDFFLSMTSIPVTTKVLELFPSCVYIPLVKIS